MQPNRGGRFIYIIAGIVCFVLLVEVILYLNHRFRLLNIGGNDSVGETTLTPTQSVVRSESQALSRETVVPDDLRGKRFTGRIISVSEKNEFTLEIVDIDEYKRNVGVWPGVVAWDAISDTKKVSSFRELIGINNLEFEFTKEGNLLIYY